MINLDVARTVINAFLVLQSSSFFISGHPSLMPAADRTQLLTVATQFKFKAGSHMTITSAYVVDHAEMPRGKL